jgi:hypothetical protein
MLAKMLKMGGIDKGNYFERHKERLKVSIKKISFRNYQLNTLTK